MFTKAKGGFSTAAIYLLLRIYLIAAETGGPTQTASANTNGLNGKFRIYFNFPIVFENLLKVFMSFIIIILLLEDYFDYSLMGNGVQYCGYWLGDGAHYIEPNFSVKIS